jgi:hypothetical protein
MPELVTKSVRYRTLSVMHCTEKRQKALYRVENSVLD